MPINVLPTVQVLQDALLCDLNTLAPFRAFIFGPQAALHRYSQAAEKTAIKLGAYNPSAAQSYAWPGRKANSIIDLSYAKLWIENAYLNYYNDYVGTGDTITSIAGYANRIKSAATNFKTSGTFPRAAALLDRDVQKGDIVFVRATVTGTTYSLWTTIKDFVNDVVAATVSPAASDAANKASQTASATSTQVTGTPTNSITTTVNGTGYDGSVDGYLSRTYTVTVTQASTGADLTTARLSVVSADGGDNVASVAPAAVGSATAIGTHGLTITFNRTVGTDNLLVGMQWTVAVAQVWTPPTATSSGTYSGPSNTTYIAKVVQGGTNPQLSISTTTGIDYGANVTVTAAATPIPIGNYGVQVAFSAAKLVKGDTYYIPVVGVGQGAVKTLVLSNDLPVAMQSVTDMDVRLFINKSALNVPSNNSVNNAVNWSADQNYMNVKANIQVLDPSWTSNGVEQLLPVYQGTVYVEYREWVTDNANQIISFTDISQVPTVLGTVDPDNPIAFAITKALQNTPGAVLQNKVPQDATRVNTVRCGVLDGDPNDATLKPWSDALTMITGVDQIYNLVPLTTNTAVFDLVVAHVKAQSDPLIGLRRSCLLPAAVTTPTPVVTMSTTTDGNVALATITQDPGTVSTSFTYLRVPAGNAHFITNGVQPGDVVRYWFGVDAFGNPSWTEYVVSSVISEDALKLTTGPSTAATTAQKVQVWRNLSKDQIVSQINAMATKYSSKLVQLLWPDKLQVAGVDVAGYHGCAALAGLYGAIPSHQSLTNVQLLGFDAIPRSTSFLTKGNLNGLTTGGVLVLSQASDGTVYVQRDVTTDISTIQNYEGMVRRNSDMVAYSMMAAWGEYLGYCNNTMQTMAAISNSFFTQVGILKALNNIARLGPPVYGLTLDNLQQDSSLPDRIQASMTMNGPYPLNGITLTIVV
jgi:hypothetical protein